MTASKVTVLPTSEAVLASGAETKIGHPSLAKVWIISLPLLDPLLMLMLLLMMGVTEYSVCSRSFSVETSEAVDEAELQEAAESSDT